MISLRKPPYDLPPDSSLEEAVRDILKLVSPEGIRVSEIAQLREDNQRYRNGFLNLMKAFEEAPGLPLELLSEDDQAKWTDIITSILMVCGILEHDGRPLTMLESLAQAVSLPQKREDQK